jgi:hypothetical protein
MNGCVERGTPRSFPDAHWDEGGRRSSRAAFEPSLFRAVSFLPFRGGLPDVDEASCLVCHEAGTRPSGILKR